MPEILPFILIGIHSSDISLALGNLTNFQKIRWDWKLPRGNDPKGGWFYRKKKMFNPKTLRSLVSFRKSEKRKQIAEKIIRGIEKIEEERKEDFNYS